MSQPQAAVQISNSESSKKSKDLKAHRPEKWETHTIGDFLLKLYKQKVLTKHYNWIVSKERVRNEFSKYLKEPGNEHFEKAFIKLNGTADIGTLLFRTRFLINTQRGSSVYRIRDYNLIQYRDYKLDETDKIRRNVIGGGTSDFGNDTENDAACDNEDDEGKLLIYQGSELQMRKAEFSAVKLGCFVCQLNFSNPLELEDHIVFHSEESNFLLQSSSSFKKFDTSIFKITYTPCKNSHIMRFLLQTKLPNVLIEKIILVQSKAFHYLNDARVPYKIDGKDTFYVNSQFFTEFLEQPIIIIFHTNSEDMRLMEQHHFVHSEPFPVVELNLNPHRLSSDSEFETIYEVSEYPAEDDLVKAMENDFPIEYLIKIRPEFYDYIAENKTLSLQNIRTVLSTLLQIEDLEIKRAYYLLLQREVKLRRCEEIYSLKLKYLWWSSEITGGRLQYLPDIGDEIFLVQESAESITLKNSSIFENLLKQGYENFRENFLLKQSTFVGRIISVVDGRILFKSDQSILLDKLYMVIIYPMRSNLIRQQKALASLDSLSNAVATKFLFPENVKNPISLSSKNLVLQNEGIRDDEDQLQAVRNITSDSEMNAPYIIVGGPGSGKTAVIVESILQLYLRYPNSKMLVVASKDSACDEIALRLCKVLCKMHDEHAIARIYGYNCKQRQRREKIDELLLEYSNLYGKHYFLPSVTVLHEFRILVCTVEVVGRLTLGGFGRTSDRQGGVFTHIFLDDGATLTEPESLLCLVDILTSSTKLVIAGDPKQMDPTIYSSRAKDLGLGVSLMERLLAYDCYINGDEDFDYNRSLLTKLVRNYRSHPKIVYLFNYLYYENKLISSTSIETITYAQHWYRNPNPDFPIIFHEVKSCANADNAEINNSSCVSNYNAQEVDVVMNYIKDFMYNGLNDRKVAQNEIGIISPYKKQALRIQDQLNLRGWYQIDVGTPEDFLGKEKSIIIVSFVWEMSKGLDILNNSRRLNFMITRAKSLMILVGNTKVLNEFSDLKAIIDECRKNGSLLHGNSFLWHELNPQNLSLDDIYNNDNINNDQDDGHNDDDDDYGDDDDNDDTRSQCSEMSTTDGKKRRKRNRYRGNKGANKAAAAAGATFTETSTPKEGNDPSNSKTNNNNKKSSNDKQNIAINPLDELLENLPSIPPGEAEALNDVEKMKQNIIERMQKLKVEPSSLTSKVAETLDFVVVENPSDAITASQKNDDKNKNKNSQHQQFRVQKQLNHGNAAAAAAGHGHVKRLDHNNQKRQANNNSKANSDKKNNQNTPQKGSNHFNNGNKNRNNQQQQQESKVKQSSNELFNFVSQMSQYQQPQPLMQLPYQYQQQPSIGSPYFQQITQFPQNLPQQRHNQMPVNPLHQFQQQQQQLHLQQTQQQQHYQMPVNPLHQLQHNLRPQQHQQQYPQQKQQQQQKLPRQQQQQKPKHTKQEQPQPRAKQQQKPQEKKQEKQQPRPLEQQKPQEKQQQKPQEKQQQKPQEKQQQQPQKKQDQKPQQQEQPRPPPEQQPRPLQSPIRQVQHFQYQERRQPRQEDTCVIA